MHRNFWSNVVLVVVLCSRFLMAGIDDGLIFYAPFENSLYPVFSAGDGKPKFNKMPVFADGPVGKYAELGGEVQLSYMVEGNAIGSEGSLSVWVKPTDWHCEDRRNHRYISIPGRWIFQWYGPSVWTSVLWMNGNKIVWGSSGYPGGPIEQGEWVNLTITWGSNGCVIYYNGEYLRHTDGDVKGMYDKKDLEPDGGVERNALPWAYSDSRLFLGDEHSKTGFDELMIYNRQLSPSEVLGLYRRSGRSLERSVFQVPVVMEEGLAGVKSNHVAVVVGFVDRFGHVTERDVSAELSCDSKNLYVNISSEKGETVSPDNYVRVLVGKNSDTKAEDFTDIKVTANPAKNGELKLGQYRCGGVYRNLGG